MFFNARYIFLFLILGISLRGYSQSSCAICNNADFESGTGGGWTYSDGSDAKSTNCNLSPDFCIQSTGVNPPQHVLQTAGNYDPMVGGTILPVVSSFGGNQSLRLGDGNAVMGDGSGVGSKAARATFTYQVQAATANFTFRYAVVVEEPATGFPNHNDDERPFFNVAVRDANGNKISCGDLYVVARPPITDFTQTNNHTRNVWYRGWSTVVLPFAAYIGQCVSIEFSTGDCALGAHFGYAYIDASCGPAEVVTSAPNACGGFRLAAPKNANTYAWTNKAGGTTGIQGPANNQTVDVNKAGTYQVVMSSLAGPNCSTTLEITVTDPGPSPVSFNPFTGCAGSYTQFTDTSTPSDSATGWSWDFNADNIADEVIRNPQHVFPSNGTYPVTLTIFIGNCSNSITQDVYVDLPIYPIIDPAGPFCISSPSVTLNASIAGGTWSGPGIIDAANGVFDPAKANVGNNAIIYATPESCPGKDTINIVVNAPLSDAGRDITICTGSAGNLGTQSTANYTYSWSPPNGLNFTTISNPTVSLVNNQTVPVILTYSVTTTNTVSNCVAVDAVVVTINPMPIINAGPDQTICEGSTVSLAGTSGGATTSYVWSSGSGNFNPDNSTLNAVYTPNSFETASGSVALTLTSNDPPGPCSSVNDQVVITISPVAVVSAGNDQTVCIGSTVTLAGVIAGSATSATWSGGTGTFSPSINNPNAVYTPSAAEQTAGSVTLTFTTDDPPGQCPPAFDQMRITLSPAPTADAGPDQTICSGGSARLAGSIGGSASSMIWSGGAGTYIPSNTITNSDYIPNGAEISAGAVILTITTNIAGACPPATDQMSITINPAAIDNAGVDQRICIRGSDISNTVILAASYGGSATSGVWTGGAGTYSPDNTDPNANYTLSEAETSNPNIILAYSTNDPIGPCPAASDQMLILLDQVPTVDAGPDQTICNGSTAMLSGAITGSATAVTWSGGGGTYTPSNTSLNCVYTPTAAEIAIGSVGLVLTTDDPAGPCSPVNDQMMITINPPALANAGVDQTVCSGSTVLLSGVFNGAASSGSWSGGSGTYSPNNTTSNATYTPSAAEDAAGSVNLTYTTNDPTGPCLAASDQMSITINVLPTVNAGSVQPVCFGENVTLNGSIGGSATGATWTGGAGTYSPDNTTLQAVYTPSPAEYSAGSVILTLTTNDPAGPCPAATANVTFNFFPPPVVNFVVDDPDGCPEHCVVFTDFTSVTGSIASWNWTFGDGGTSTQQSPSHCYKNTGKYDVALSVIDNNSCKASLKIDKMITVYAMPVAEFFATPNPASILEHNVTFINQSSSDVNFWRWSFGDGDTIAPNTINPIHGYPSESSGVYHATLLVHNADFCYAEVMHDITIDPEFAFFIPNAFTPRASAGTNDVFNGKGIGIIKYDLWIFDRWGNEIFHTSDLNDGWDGKANEGKHVAQEDVYVWKVNLTDVFHKKHDYLGTVTLVK